MKPTLLVLAAGMGARFGGLKQVEPVGPSGEMLIDYAVYDAIRSGFGRVVFVIRHEFEDEFRGRIGGRYAGRIAIDYAFQQVDDLPAGFGVPPDRVKPWGTAHAVRAARKVVHEPFAMINADDFYGFEAFSYLSGFLAAPDIKSGRPEKLAMVGYRLRQTFSAHGSVARGVCGVDASGMLMGVTEMTQIVPVSDGAENRDDPNAVVRLTGEETVSMNMWGFTTGIFALLESRFPAWLAVHGAKAKSEWYIPQVINELIQEGRATVRVMTSESAWFGVTYREDRTQVVAALNELVKAGVYPVKLWA